MHPAVPLVCLLPVLLAAICGIPGRAHAASSSPSASLTIACEVDGRALPLVQADSHQLWLEAGSGTLAAPDAGARWTLSGDLRDNASYVHFQPTCTIRRDGRFAEPRFNAVVEVTHLIDLAPLPKDVNDPMLASVARNAERVPDPLTAVWPDVVGQSCALAAAWILDGRIVQFQVKAVPPITATRDLVVRFELALTHEQSRGSPVVLLWSDGACERVAPFSTHKPTQAAYRAVTFNDVAALRTAISDGARLDAVSALDQSSLAHAAIDCNAMAALDVLLTSRPRLLEAEAFEGEGLLQRAAANGRVEALAMLLPKAGGSAALRRMLPIALTEAVERGHADAVELILREMFPRGVKPSDTPEALHQRAWNHGYPEIIQALAGRPFAEIAAAYRHDKERGRARGMPAMPEVQLVSHAAAGRWPMLAAMVPDLGLDLDAMSDGRSALLAACAGGHGDIVRHLITSGADVNRAGKAGTTPLMAATQANHPDLVASLLAAGAKPNTVNNDGVTALHFAAEQDAAAIVTLLLNAGADVQICSIRDVTPLDLALFAGATESVRLLTERGACIGLGAAYSLDLLQAAIVHDSPQPIETALQQGWPAVSTFAGVWPALRTAEMLGADNCARVLRAAGATSAADRPLALALEAELDAPLAVTADGVPVDPRQPDEVFPATRVRVRMLVDGSGRTLFPKVVDRCPPRLIQPVLRAALQTHFSPPRRQGQPVAVFATRHFHLPPSHERTFHEREVERKPTVRTNPAPYIPGTASKSNRTSRVVVNYVVNILGRIEQVDVVESSGKNYTDAVLLALSQWQFTPGMFRDTPVAVRQSRTFTFDPKGH